MPRVIHRSIVVTLEIVPSGVRKCTAQSATAAIARAWLRVLGQQMIRFPTRPTCQMYMRRQPLDQGAHIQILLCWIVLQVHRQEIGDFDRQS